MGRFEFKCIVAVLAIFCLALLANAAKADHYEQRCENGVCKIVKVRDGLPTVNTAVYQPMPIGASPAMCLPGALKGLLAIKTNVEIGKKVKLFIVAPVAPVVEVCQKVHERVQARVKGRRHLFPIFHRKK
jgi:hypothetical protein